MRILWLLLPFLALILLSCEADHSDLRPRALDTESAPPYMKEILSVSADFTEIECLMSNGEVWKLPAKNLEFSDVKRLYSDAHCLSCHSPGGEYPKLDFSNYVGVMKTVRANKPLRSRFLQSAREGTMPKGAPAIDKPLLDMVEAWIRLGAKKEKNLEEKPEPTPDETDPGATPEPSPTPSPTPDRPAEPEPVDFSKINKVLNASDTNKISVELDGGQQNFIKAQEIDYLLVDRLYNQRYCVTCHTEGTLDHSFGASDFNSFENVSAYIKPGSAEKSSFWSQAWSGEMPPSFHDGESPNDVILEFVKHWINEAGAQRQR